MSLFMYLTVQCVSSARLRVELGDLSLFMYLTVWCERFASFRKDMHVK